MIKHTTQTLVSEVVAVFVYELRHNYIVYSTIIVNTKIYSWYTGASSDWIGPCMPELDPPAQVYLLPPLRATLLVRLGERLL